MVSASSVHSALPGMDLHLPFLRDPDLTPDTLDLPKGGTLSAIMQVADRTATRMLIDPLLKEVGMLASVKTLSKETIQKGIEYRISDIFRGQGKYELTLLHVLAIKSHAQAMKTLLECARNICKTFSLPMPSVDVRDIRGFTPAHHAALHQDRAMLEMLYAHQASKSLVNFRCGTTEDLYRSLWIVPDRRYPTGEVVFDYSFTERSEIMKDWLCPVEVEESDHLKFIKDPLVLQDALELVYHPVVGYYTVAKSDIPQGSFVGSYNGFYLYARAGNSSFNLAISEPEEDEKTSIIDGRNGSIVSRCSDSHPNLEMSIFANDRGIAGGCYFVAIDDIKKGAVAAIDYGSNHRVKEFYLAMDLSRSEKFAQDITEEGVKQALLDGNESVEKFLKWSRISSGLYYIFETPFVLVSLLASGAFSKEKCIQLFNCLDKFFQVGLGRGKDITDLIVESLVRIDDSQVEEHFTRLKSILESSGREESQFDQIYDFLSVPQNKKVKI